MLTVLLLSSGALSAPPVCRLVLRSAAAVPAPSAATLSSISDIAAFGALLASDFSRGMTESLALAACLLAVAELGAAILLQRRR
ncbi:hypothetical protein ACQPXS_33815 [Streptomyces sp. CA-142005]|uniref:hypothetical protein n=1 Tax=Streptomyces sp. CA-142005 TaxID=3240052 RepID=UPI003D8DF5F4